MSVGWSSEWRLALRRRRLLLFNAGIPLLLVLPFALGAAPAHHAAAVVAVLFTVFGVFGSTIPLVRDGRDGLVERWLLTGVSPPAYLAGRLSAQVALDLVELAPAALLLAGVRDPSATASVLASLALTLVVANAVGVWVAAAARSLAEAALFAAVTALLLLHGAGVFRTPAPGSWQATAERLVPFRLLHDALRQAFSLPASTAAAESHGILAPLLLSGLLAALTLAAAARLLGRLRRG